VNIIPKSSLCNVLCCDITLNKTGHDAVVLFGLNSDSGETDDAD